ncbi:MULTISPECIES: hypothetical protein [Polaribacter]|uniref:Uracil phosphoribosyltransferase n=1 Tax=Polaribacter marinaquae TaxID=1642819 RepID=A0ABZ2TP01_9FLAO|nr:MULTISPECIES: hypothetical protein [unclassified Polaribacter]AQS94298.1 hypothetical protein BXQ17_09585 [Polaribacter sp. BM10]SHM88310.1 hypothetical protein SAMN05720268_1169 [Polaribacter sp. KT 15]
MIASNIFRWIGSLFTDILFLPFDWLRLTVANADLGWWVSNALNWGFLVILLVLFAYWMGESRRFVKEGTEDRA